VARFSRLRDDFCQSADSELIDWIRKDSDAALTQLYERYWEPVFLYVARVLQDGDQARDVVQETFIALWQKRKDLPEIGSLQAYLIGIARYKALRCINLSLSEERYRNSLLQFFNDHERSPEAGLMATEMERLLDAHIDRLPERMREVFVLSRREQLSYAEIAERLQISDKTVKKQIHNALKHLRSVLDEQHMWATILLSAMAVH
jgi:RNA polymerase sigma-70 factor (ECF subfamily)